jgi:hypothetical protein
VKRVVQRGGIGCLHADFLGFFLPFRVCGECRMMGGILTGSCMVDTAVDRCVTTSSDLLRKSHTGQVHASTPS